MGFNDDSRIPSAAGAAASRPVGGNMGNFSLAGQASIYSLTLEEFQNTLGEPGKNFGSMNMEKLIKNIRAAAEGSTAGKLASHASLQRQGSLTLSRTLSRKIVDDVWRDLYRESTYGSGNGQVNAQCQDFLVKA